MLSMAALLGTGSAPGRPKQMGRVCVLGSAPDFELATAEHLRVQRSKLGMDLQADDGFPILQNLFELLHLPNRPHSAFCTQRLRSASRCSAFNSPLGC